MSAPPENTESPSAAPPRNPGPPLDDLALVRGALDDRGDARQVLLERMHCIPRILLAKNQLQGRPLSEQELEDLAQDVWIAVWKKLERFRGPSLEAWVYRFCALDFLKRLRDLGRRSLRNLDGDLAQAGNTAAPSEPSMLDYEDLYRSLESLGEEEATIVELKHFDDLTFQEIAERLGIPANTAKSRYYRGIAKLREQLREKGADNRRRQA